MNILKALFSSKARVKLLKMFLLHPENEYFVREITRMLDEQINSVRRELLNFKKIGLVKFRTKNRKKYFYVNKEFPIYEELRAIFIKTQDIKEDIVQFIHGLGEVQLLVLNGYFSGKEDAFVDLLIVGDIKKEELEKYLESLHTTTPLKYSIMDKDNFLYRIEYNDNFITSLLKDPESLIPINKFRQITKK